MIQKMRDNPGNDYTIAEYCDALEVSQSGFFAWRKRPPSARDTENAKIKKVVLEIHSHRHTRSYGSPRMTPELNSRGIRCGENRVARIMRDEGLRGASRRPFRPATTLQDGTAATAPNLLRYVEPTAPGQVYAGDITYVATREGWLYLAVVLDMFGRRLLGWQLGENMQTWLVSAAMTKAAVRQPRAPGAFFHSDRGCQYTSGEFGKLCSTFGLGQSMSRTGNCWDNAWSESFFASVKSECFPENGIFETKEIARRAIFDYLETFYNRSRLHSALGYLSPDDFVARYHRKLVTKN
jgi:transposase InsO family protein